MTESEPRAIHECDLYCRQLIRDCDCGRGTYKSCKHHACYECFLDRASEYVGCILCGKWHKPGFDTCFKCRPETRGRDDAAKALRQLILWRDEFTCRYCGAFEGDMQVDPRLVRPACRVSCIQVHAHRLKDDDGLRHTMLHVDHIVPCAHGGLANEWNLQVLCGVCNISKGATWYPGCRHDGAKTNLCKRYRFIAASYFPEPERQRFLSDWAAYRATGTWDPKIHHSWRDTQKAMAA